MSSNSEFKQTYNLFANYINYTHPLSYDEWMDTDDDDKVAYLYCQFYREITLAWYKVVSVYSQEADGVDEIIQYLIKNVDKIKADEERFKSPYIYKVAYNCLYCLCRDPNKKKQIFENEISNIVVHGDDELDLFDLYQSKYCKSEYEDLQSSKERFWSKVENLGTDAVVVVAMLLNDPMNWTQKGNKRFTQRDYDKITPQRFKEIVDMLKESLSEFKYMLEM